MAVDDLVDGCHEGLDLCIERHAADTVITACDDTDELSARGSVFRNCHCGMSGLFFQSKNIRKSGIRADVGIAGDKSGLIALGASDHSRLALNALRPVNKGHAAALSQCHCQAVAGYRLHDRGDHGDGQLDRRLPGSEDIH